MKHKIKQQQNQTAGVQLELDKLKKQKESLLRQYEANQESIQEFNPKSDRD